MGIGSLRALSPRLRLGVLLGVCAVCVALAAVLWPPAATLLPLRPVGVTGSTARAKPSEVVVRWRRDLGAPTTGPVAVLRAGVAATTADGRLHLYSHRGELRFALTLPGAPTRVEGGATALRDGMLALGTRSGRVVVVGPGGQVRATRKLPSPVLAPVTEGPGGTLWVASGSTLYGLDRGLRTRFSAPVSGPVVAAPTVGPAGDVYLATQGHRLFGFTRTATERFAVDLGQELDAPPLLHGDLVYVAGDGGLLAGVSAKDGRVVFRRALDGHVRSPLAWLGGRLWLQTMGPRPALLALDPRDGAIMGGHRFSFVDDAETGSRSGVRLGPGAASLWAGGPDDAVHVFDLHGRPTARLATGGDVDGTPTPGPGGVVYVGSQDGVLRALALQ